MRGQPVTAQNTAPKAGPAGLRHTLITIEEFQQDRIASPRIHVIVNCLGVVAVLVK